MYSTTSKRESNKSFGGGGANVQRMSVNSVRDGQNSSYSINSKRTSLGELPIMEHYVEEVS